MRLPEPVPNRVLTPEARRLLAGLICCLTVVGIPYGKMPPFPCRKRIGSSSEQFVCRIQLLQDFRVRDAAFRPAHCLCKSIFYTKPSSVPFPTDTKTQSRTKTARAPRPLPLSCAAVRFPLPLHVSTTVVEGKRNGVGP